MKDRDVALMFVLVLCVCGALLYLDWRRQGEVELLHERLDSLDAAAAKALDSFSRENGPAVVPAVDRILRAPDDRTLADIAREGV